MALQQYRPSQFQILPPVVKNLLIINAIMYFATTVIAEKFDFDLNRILGLHYPSSAAFYPFQYITYMFMHGSLAHIAFNMLALWMFGNALENVWGQKRFFTYYMVCGIGAGLVNTVINYYDIESTRAIINDFYNAPSAITFDIFLHKENILSSGTSMINNIMNYFFEQRSTQELTDFVAQWKINPSDGGAFLEAKSFCESFLDAKINNVTIGASGAIFGLLLAFGMAFPETIILLYFAIPIKAKYFVVIYGLLELFLGVQQNAADNVAHFAHLGGMLFGFILLKIWRHKRFHH